MLRKYFNFQLLFFNFLLVVFCVLVWVSTFEWLEPEVFRFKAASVFSGFVVLQFMQLLYKRWFMNENIEQALLINELNLLILLSAAIGLANTLFGFSAIFTGDTVLPFNAFIASGVAVALAFIAALLGLASRSSRHNEQHIFRLMLVLLALLAVGKFLPFFLTR